MTLLYRFTSGVHPIQGSTPWDTGRTGVSQEAIPTTRQEIYDAIADALYNAGWTRYDRQLAGASGTGNTNRDDVWFSRGEAGDKWILLRTTLSNSGAAGDRYLWWTIAPTRNDSATATNVQFNWNGTTTVVTTDTSQLRARSGSLPGSFIREDVDGQWFEVTAIVANTNVTVDAAGFTIPNTGLANSSVLTPTLEREIGSQAFVETTPFNDDNHRWDLTASDFNADFQIVCDLDFFWAVFQNVNHTGTMFVAGVGDGEPFDVNPNHFVLDTAVTSGDFVELITLDPVTKLGVDPRVLGWRPGDVFQIVNVDPNGNPRAETQVTTEIQADRIICRRLAYDYDGDDQTVNPQVEGAKFGQIPMPIMKTIGMNQEIETFGTLVPLNTPFFAQILIDRGNQLGGTDGDFTEPSTSGNGEGQDSPAKYDVGYAQLGTHAQTNDEYGSGTTGNERTLRFTQRTVALITKNGAYAMKIPFLEANNITSVGIFYPHDNMLRDRVTPNEDFVPFRFTATSARVYVLGPTPG